MTAMLALVRKNLADSRWILGISAAALFGLSWLFVYAANRFEVRARRTNDPIATMRRMAFARALGGPAADGSSTSLEVMFWRHPFIILIVALWPIARGSIAVGGELERGTLDMILSRPITRSAYLTAQVATTLIGLIVLGLALVAGNQVANRFNVIDEPPSVFAVLRPAYNVMALGLSMYGYTLLVSAIDSVRWRATLVGSVLTLGGYIAQVVANIPNFENWKWLEKISIFTVFDPVEAALGATQLARNVTILSGVGLAGVVLAYAAFTTRDLPTSG